MKKLSFLVLFIILIMVNASAQNIPRGMKYQAVARDLKGEVLSNAKIELRINLLSKTDATQSSHYSEIHSVVTNQLGLFTLVVGEGKMETGDFEKVPWSSADIWMEIQIKTNGQSDFTSISNSQLLAVPYAYYAATAGVLAGEILQGGTANKGFHNPRCPCEGGLSQIKVLYRGETGDSIRVYRNKNLTELLIAFKKIDVYDGAILTINAVNFPDGKLKNDTYFQVLSGVTGLSLSVYEIPTECEEDKEPWEFSLGETFGNFSVMSHRDRKNGAECTVCDIRKEWQVGGNGLMDLCNMLGTKSNTDLIFITNNLDRLKIKKDGDVEIKRSLSIGGSLTVDSSVLLNRITGSTLNHGALFVDGPTDLNNSLNVDGPTDLNSRLYVNNGSPSRLSGSLQVEGVTDLNAALNVNNMSPALLTGTLRVNKDATLKEKLLVTALYDTDTTTGTPPSGAFQLDGGAYIKKNVYIGGTTKFGGPVAFGGAVNIKNATESINYFTGALIVNGGVGIGKRLNVLGDVKFEREFKVEGITTINNKLNANGQVTIFTAPGNGNENSFDNYPLRVMGSNQGIAIKVAGSRTNANNFISFWDGTQMWGRIEGEVQNELETTNSDYKFANRQYIGDIVFGSIDVLAGGYDVIVSLSNVLQATSSSTACVGLGACVTTPIPSWIVGSVAQLVIATAKELATIGALVFTGVNYNDWKAFKSAEIGVTYQSGAGDYAEYLRKAQPSETFQPGDIVGVKGGLISKNITGAEKIMAISKRPIVLGNMPQPGKEKEFEKVAFLGQIPVKVFGKVNVGDYILPNGNNNGVGIAVSSSAIKSEDIKKILGIAWSGTMESQTISIINVAVGLNVNDNQKVVDELQAQVTDLKNQFADLNNKLEKFMLESKSPGSYSDKKNLTAVTTASPQLQSVKEVETVSDVNNEVVYNHLTRAEILQAAEAAEKIMRESGTDINTHPFWTQYKNSPSFKEAFINKIITLTENGIAEAKMKNAYRFSK